MFEWIKPKNWSLVRVYRDFENFADWRRVVKEQESNIQSKYSKWKLQHSKLYDIYVTLTLDEADLPLPEIVKRTKVLEMLNPLNKYLDEELGFAGNLTCEFNQFVDDKNEPTLSYLIVYSFNFEKFSLLWLFRFLVITGLIVFFTLHFGLIPLGIAWITSLL
jgi:hypothetical protein